MRSKVLYYIWPTVAVVMFIAAIMATLALLLSLGFVTATFSSPLTYVFVVFGLWTAAFMSLYLSQRYRQAPNRRTAPVKGAEIAALVLLFVLLIIAIGDAFIW